MLDTAMFTLTRGIAALFVFAGLSCGAASAQDSPDGAELYRNYCSACHGATGEGDGPVAGVMQVTVPNLRTLAMRSGGRFPTDAVTAYIDGTRIPLAHGSRQMPIWGDVFLWDDEGASVERAEQRIAAIVDYLMVLQH